MQIDIDNTPVEMLFIQQLLNDAHATSLVEEFFFEHHVNFPVMMKPYYWSNVPKNETMVLKDSCDIFVKLRHMGVRAHGWV